MPLSLGIKGTLLNNCKGQTNTHMDHIEHLDHFDTLFPVPPMWLEPTIDENREEIPDLIYIDDTEFLGFI